VVNGADDFMTGMRQMISGRNERGAIEATVTVVAHSAGMNQQNAEALGSGTSMVLGFVSPSGPMTSGPRAVPALARLTTGERVLVTATADATQVARVADHARGAQLAANGARAGHTLMMSSSGDNHSSSSSTSGSGSSSSSPHSGGATRPRSELLSADRRAARSDAIAGLWERLRAGSLAERDIHTLERLQQTHGAEAIQTFEETGRLPRDFEFSHLYSASEYPEFARRSELGVLTDRAEHIQGHHGGDTSIPLHGEPRSTSWEENWGTQISSDPNYLGLVCE
jgi:hypothetical protein